LPIAIERQSRVNFSNEMRDVAILVSLEELISGFTNNPDQVDAMTRSMQ
jgi:hypothetical protein